PGLTGGTGFWSVYAFLNFIDRVHALGKGVNLLQFGLNAAGEEYGLASYFMISNGTDSRSDDSTNPNNWFSGYSADLGPALGPRTYTNGVFQRNFAGGIALMGEPGLPAQTISLPGWFQRLDGSWVHSVTLGGSQGIILLGSNAAPRSTSASSNTSSNSSTVAWNGLHGWFTGKAAVAKNADGRLEVFARGGDNALWHIWQTSAGGAWSGWSSLGGSLTGNPAVVTSGDGRLEVFARGGDNGLWHRWQTSAGGNWSGWAGLGGGIQSDPSPALDQNGRLEVFAQGSDNALWHIWQNTPGGTWSGWAGLGGSLVGQPGTVTNWDGRIEVFARGTDNALWHVWQT